LARSVILKRAVPQHLSHKASAGNELLSDPDRWWETHDGIRTEMVEFKKLWLDVARQVLPPLSLPSPATLLPLMRYFTSLRSD